MDNDTFSVLSEAVANRGLFANSATVKPLVPDKIKKVIDTNFDKLSYNPEDSQIVVEYEVNYWGDLVIVNVPKERMYSAIILLSGNRADPGQAEGGFLPDYTNEKFCNINILMAPFDDALFTSIKVHATSITCPVGVPGFSITPQLSEANKRMYGSFTIENIGPNQNSNSFDINARIAYGGDIIPSHEKACFMVTGTVGAVDVDPTDIVVTSENNSDIVYVGDTLKLNATLIPTNASGNLQWEVTPGTGTATVDDGVVTPGTSGTVDVTAKVGDVTSNKFRVNIIKSGA